MRAKLKRLHSPDIDLESFWPENHKNFCFLLQAMIGPEDEKGEESFDILVCTPAWLISNYSESEIVNGRHMLIVFSYDLTKIKNYITKHCENITGNDWLELANKLSRLGRWEFEDYQEKA